MSNVNPSQLTITRYTVTRLQVIHSSLSRVLVLIRIALFILVEMRKALLAAILCSLFYPSWAFVSQNRPVSRMDVPTMNFQKERQGVSKHITRQRDISLFASSIMLPSIQTIALSCLIPTSLGYIRYEYGVSYGYGSSVAILAVLILRQLSYGTMAYWHAWALIFYGIRLNLFLLYRELYITRFRKFRQQIEERRTATMKGGDTTSIQTRLQSRTPFVIGCATLYACLVAPLIITSQEVMSSNVFLVNCFIGLTWVGFVVAALGDLQKSFIKATLGEDVLVKGTLFSRLRHPNYTGEALAWTSSFLASVTVAIMNRQPNFILPLLAATFGWIGIIGVLVMAATGLEKRQFEKYKDTVEYQQWIKRSWAGPTWKRN